MPQNTEQNDTTTNNAAPKSTFKTVLIVIGVILMLFVCVTTFVLVIPKTNIYRFNDLPQQILDVRIN